MKKLKDITVTVAQLKKLVDVLPTNLPDDKTFTSQELKSLVRRGVYAQTLANLLVQTEMIQIPYNSEGIFENNWKDGKFDLVPYDQIRRIKKNANLSKSVRLTSILVKMNAFLNSLQCWYTNDYVGEEDNSIEESFNNFNDLMQDAHDWVIARLLKAGVLRDGDLVDGTPLRQEDGYSFFTDFGIATIAPSK
jgi:hypothetical protein